MSIGVGWEILAELVKPSAQNPFYHPIEYSPTDKADIDRAAAAARRFLTPHTLLLQMLLSRFQAVRYSRPGLVLLILRLVLRSARAYRMLRLVHNAPLYMQGGAHFRNSTHPLARENRFSFLIFGFETLKSTRMDSACEHNLRDALYSVAFSWFSTAPQCVQTSMINAFINWHRRWSFGADRVQLEAEIKLLNEFLLLVQGDFVRDSHHISALDTSLHPTRKSSMFHITSEKRA